MIDVKKINSLFEDTSVFDSEGSQLMEYARHKIFTKFKSVGIMPEKINSISQFGGRPQPSVNSNFRLYDFTYQLSFDQLGLTQAPDNKFLKKLLMNYIKQFSKFFNGSKVRLDIRRGVSKFFIVCDVSSDMIYILKKLKFVDDTQQLIHTRFCFFEIYFNCYEADGVVSLSCNFTLQDYHFMKSVDELVSFDTGRINVLNLYIEELLKVTDLIVKAIRLIDLTER